MKEVKASLDAQLQQAALVLISNKGYEWRQQHDGIRIKDCFHLEDASIFFPFDLPPNLP